MTSNHTAPPPLMGIKVLELAGLAPGPFAGMMLADFGASVLRVDRSITPNPAKHIAGTHSTTSPSSSPSSHLHFPAPTEDVLARHKSSIAINLKSRQGVALILSLIPHIDILIDPFRPGVLEKLGLCPKSVLLPLNPSLIVARLTGFRRDGKYAHMAGHDINYIAVSGVLDMFGRKGEIPYPPANVVGDFAGGGAMCVLGVLLAMIHRQRTSGGDTTASGKGKGKGEGQIVEANMVDGSTYLSTMPRMGTKLPLWDKPRGTNILDGGCPFYSPYETKDGKYMAVGALEPQFFDLLLKGLGLSHSSLPGPRHDQSTWPALKTLFTHTFKSKTRAEWERIFDRVDACVTPIFSHAELEQDGFDQRPAVTLRTSPGFAITPASTATASSSSSSNINPSDPIAPPEVRGQGAGMPGEGWYPAAISPGEGGENTLTEWLGWTRGRDYQVENGGLVLSKHSVAKL